MSKEGWFVVSPGGRSLAGPFKTKAVGQSEARSRSLGGDDLKVTVKYGVEDGWDFTAKPEPQSETRMLTFKQFMLSEKVHTIRNPAIKPRGAPADKARVFDKQPNQRSAIAKLNHLSAEHKYFGVEFSDEGEYVQVLVAKQRSKSHGINVLFYPDGKVEGQGADAEADRDWEKDKKNVIKAAKAALMDKDLPGIYDGLGGKSVKRGAGKLSVDIS